MALIYFLNLCNLYINSITEEQNSNYLSLIKLFSADYVFNVRNFQSVLLFFGRGIMFALSLTFSQILVPMPKIHTDNNKLIIWSEQQKSILISSSIFGTIISQVPGGLLSCRYGGKYVLLCGVLCASLANLTISKLLELDDWRIIIALRFFGGLADGLAQPAYISILSKWIPVSERGRMVTFVYSGGFFMNTIMLATSGIIACNLGWEVFFYIWGGIGVLWALLWYFFGYETPDDHPTISNEEFSYIETSLQEVKSNEYIPFPWKSVLSSRPFYAVLFCQCCGEWTFSMLAMNTSRYLQGVFGVSVEENGIYSSIPIFVRLIASFVYIGIDSAINSRLKLSRSRKMFNTIGQCGASFGCLVLGFMGKGSLIAAVTIMGLCYGLNTATNFGYLVNHMDIAPNHAGTLKGITNVAEGLTSIMSNNYLGIIVYEVTNQNQWKIVFITSFCILFCGGIIFLLFGSTKVQDWNYSIKKNKEILLQENLNRIKIRSNSFHVTRKCSLAINMPTRNRSKSLFPTTAVPDHLKGII